MSNQDTSGSSSYYETAAESPNQSMYSDLESTSFSDSHDSSAGDVHMVHGGTGFGDYDSVTDGELTPRPSTVLTVISASVGHQTTPSTVGNISITSSDGVKSGTSTPSTLNSSPNQSAGQVNLQVNPTDKENMDFSPVRQPPSEDIVLLMDMVTTALNDQASLVDLMKMMALRIQEHGENLSCDQVKRWIR